LSSLSRADCVVITRTDQVDDVMDLSERIERLTGNAPIFQSRMRVMRSKQLNNAPETIQSPIAAFCAVGNPHSFFNQIQHDVVLQKAFPDHHRYTQRDIDSLIDDARRAGAHSLITTAKDAVKLHSISFSLPCYVLEIEPQIENEAELVRMILNSAKE
jgi:tetraacyldisaccharide 4'-kinase